MCNMVNLLCYNNCKQTFDKADLRALITHVTLTTGDEDCEDTNLIA